MKDLQSKHVWGRPSGPSPRRRRRATQILKSVSSNERGPAAAGEGRPYIYSYSSSY